MLFFDLRVHSPLHDNRGLCAALSWSQFKFTSHARWLMCRILSLLGTKIVYERTFLMNLRNSPLANTPPKNIPCHLMKDDKSAFHHHNHQNQMNGTYHPPKSNPVKDKSNGWSKIQARRQSSPDTSHDDQFEMDM